MKSVRNAITDTAWILDVNVDGWVLRCGGSGISEHVAGYKLGHFVEYYPSRFLEEALARPSPTETRRSVSEDALGP